MTVGHHNEATALNGVLAYGEPELPAPTGRQNEATALSRVLEPHSVAIIGASANPDKRGYQIIKALKNAGYGYPILPVNPKGGTILELPVFSDVDALPECVDIAVIVRPAEEVPDILIQCGKKGIAGAVVLAHGFRERGDKGSAAETRLLDALKKSGVRIIGPNTSGMLNCTVQADLIGLPELPPSGPISVLTQSGNMVLSVVEDSRSINGPGFDVIAGLGNQTDIEYGELIEELSRRESTRSIAIYNEGFLDGRGFLDAAARVGLSCPIVMLRGGRSIEGRKAALSHTGSIAGADEIAVKVLAQMGVTLVDRSDELLPVAALLATSPLPKPKTGIAVLTDGGGHATLAVDALSRAGVPLASLSEDTKTKLRSVLGDEASVENPIDVASAADAYPDVFPECIEILASDPQVGLVLTNGLFGAYHIRFDESLLKAENSAAERIVALRKASGLPMVFHSCYGNRKPENHDILRNGGIQIFPSIDWAVTGSKALFERANWLSKQNSNADRLAPDARRVFVPSGLSAETTAREMLQKLGVDTGEWSAASDAGAVSSVVSSFGKPCAVKVDSSVIVHKSDVGGVRLGVTREAASAAADDITRAMASQAPPVTTFGFIVTPMVDHGLELFVGAVNDSVFGPVVLFGSGGVLVEAVKDVTFRAAPLSPAEALDMINETGVAKILDGFRNYRPVDKRSLAEFISSVSLAVMRMENLSELDINPIIANESGIYPVDVRLVGK
ncbi:CoA-binding protein [Mesorhizobium sp. M7A.F.Ca.CA.001.07.2.1]|uniref:acetate--CoA ligase family protein n=2 Tax=Phyllobacteriaceae TaxID=69277 RepID=UPI000FCCBE4B|nr:MULTISPECIES: acetate--CoA ligase [Mesorhizobium]RWN88451.1 MAG: CoA-binding protein [Mesorhizobium sp.]MCF6127884.1 acetate--CoA ligase family protein [Mesorhizobium ciceri]MCQ8818562.1 acetate--CoA ligase family protein [Mesorhizobium sp. SEMIA396]RUU82164.1 CoA-binding protein [Mesorhizobium sp. M7A.F.Ca.MR.362.00.0.0]RUX78309.1 CoA-binding protein [Mesorhizobium sp. M7A.F.Ca.CA.004.08.2.1]